ncbi:MAG: iron-sulfur cluster repair di-iron protein [Gammaproteobacteria bacterium]
MTDLSIASTVGDVVARDLRSAAVFARHRIDFCCGGRRSIEDACLATGEDPEIVIRELEALALAGEPPEDRSGWTPTRALDRVVTHHHAYVRRQIPLIQGYLAKLIAAHGSRRPELHRVREIFAGLAIDLLHHMEKEEQILFPFIKAMVAARSRNAPLPPSPFGTIQNPVRMMEAEHQQAGEDLRLLQDLTRGYQPPDDACPTWRACYAELAAFERDLHEHVHLENNVLFPAAAALEEIG